MSSPSARSCIDDMDTPLANWLHEHATPSLTSAMRVVTNFGAPPFVIVATLFVCLWLSIRKDWWTIGLLALCVGGGMLFNTGLKTVFERARPQFEPALAHARGHSFPSGHVAAATLFYGSVAMLVWHRTVSLPARIGAILLAVVVVLLVSFSRLYLGVHYLTDVLVAQVMSLIWLGASVMIFKAIRARPTVTSPSGQR
jgi:membrane-associated phospholipid phosphatase